MSACRRKKVRKLRLRRRRVCGGYMPGSWIPQPENKANLSSLREMYKQKNKKNKIGWTDYLNWYKLADKLANKNVIDESTMNSIMYQYSSGDETSKKRAIERMSDELVIRDIMTNPEDYIKEYMKGKHRRNNWAKWVGGAAEVAAILAGAYGATKFVPGAAAKVASWKKLWGNTGSASSTSSGTSNNFSGFSTQSPEDAKGKVFDLSGMKFNTGDNLEEGAEAIVEGYKNNALNRITFAENPDLISVGNSTATVATENGPLTMPIDSLPKYVERNPGGFGGLVAAMNSVKNFSGQYKKSWWRRLLGWLFGSGFRVTRKGRHLVNRYRRHLRRRRR